MTWLAVAALLVAAAAFAWDRHIENRTIDTAGFANAPVTVLVRRTTRAWMFWRRPRAEISLHVGSQPAGIIIDANADQVAAFTHLAKMVATL